MEAKMHKNSKTKDYARDAKMCFFNLIVIKYETKTISCAYFCGAFDTVFICLFFGVYLKPVSTRKLKKQSRPKLSLEGWLTLSFGLNKTLMVFCNVK